MTNKEKQDILDAAINRAYTAIAETSGDEMKEQRFGDLLFNIHQMETFANGHDNTEDDFQGHKGEIGDPNLCPGPTVSAETIKPAPEPQLTKDEVKAKLLALSDQYDDLDVSVVMESMGYSKLSDIPAEKYSLLLDKVAEVVKGLA